MINDLEDSDRYGDNVKLLVQPGGGPPVAIDLGVVNEMRILWCMVEGAYIRQRHCNLN